MANFGHFVDGQSNRRCEHEQEGFARAIDVPGNHVPCCGSEYSAFEMYLADARGPLPGVDPAKEVTGYTAAFLHRRAIEWETSPAEAARQTVFTWIAGSQVRPAMRPAFPYVTAKLFVNGKERITFPLGYTVGFSTKVDGFALVFEPRRFQSLVEAPHRNWWPHGVSGFYRLEVPASELTPGKPLRLRVELVEPGEGIVSFFYLSPRTDALRVNLTTLRDEVAQLQADMVQLRQSHEMLYMQFFPQLGRRITGERGVALQDEKLHYHPPNLTVLRNGEVVIAVREGSDHLSIDGRIVLVRSKDGGRTWGRKELLYDLGESDHRSAAIFELSNGDWVTHDYRAGSEYNEHKVWDLSCMTGPTLWGAWSSDKGKTWSFTDRPLTVPGMHPYAEVERHMIQLPSGRLILAANYMPFAPDGVHANTDGTQIAIFHSDDNGRHWSVLAKLPNHPFTLGECTMLRTKSGRIVLIARSQPQGGTNMVERGALLQSVSLDEGLTWSPLVDTPMSSMNSPGHLLQLQDGRILCTHASRAYPGSIFTTLSRDEGRTWDTANTKVVTNDLQNFDSCYPTSGQLADGTIITTWYANVLGKFYLGTLRYNPSEL
ncbi:MAG: glycoside hydrolase [Planctomycetes bacterium]|nr:glycoside hydrolase [Planctomycetota bacterium]